MSAVRLHRLDMTSSLTILASRWFWFELERLGTAELELRLKPQIQIHYQTGCSSFVLELTRPKEFGTRPRVSHIMMMQCIVKKTSETFPDLSWVKRMNKETRNEYEWRETFLQPGSNDNSSLRTELLLLLDDTSASRVVVLRRSEQS